MDKDKWDVINGFANWFAAFGTVAAVVVSLRLARSAQAVRAKLAVSARFIYAGDGTAGESAILFEVINTGFRSFEVISLGWKYGKGKNQRASFQLFNWAQSSPLPKRLQEGERGVWRFSPNEGAGWFQRFAGHFSSDWERELATLRAVATLSTGETIECAPSKPIMDRLRKTLMDKPS